MERTKSILITEEQFSKKTAEVMSNITKDKPEIAVPLLLTGLLITSELCKAFFGDKDGEADGEA